MKYFQDNVGKVHGIDPTDAVDLEAAIAAELIDITSSWPPPSNPLPAFIASVQSALTASDETMKRMQEAVALGLNTVTATDMVAFVNYRRSLRTLLTSTTVGVLPTKPAYPVGT